jgi:hypothetical protein
MELIDKELDTPFVNENAIFRCYSAHILARQLKIKRECIPHFYAMSSPQIKLLCDSRPPCTIEIKAIV